MKHAVSRDDILPVEAYAKIRSDKRREAVTVKKLRRVEVGPFASFMFESFDTMWLQIQEMLYIEKGGEEQIQGELDAYNPLIPNGSELTATVMFEIDEPIRRKNALARLGGVEETAFFKFGDYIVRGVPEPDQDRTSEEGKASSVQFIHFPFTPDQIAAFRTPHIQLVLGFDHPAYAHMAVVPDPVRAALAGDFA